VLIPSNFAGDLNTIISHFHSKGEKRSQSDLSAISETLWGTWRSSGIHPSRHSSNCETEGTAIRRNKDRRTWRSHDRKPSKGEIIIRGKTYNRRTQMGRKGPGNQKVGSRGRTILVAEDLRRGGDWWPKVLRLQAEPQRGKSA